MVFLELEMKTVSFPLQTTFSDGGVFWSRDTVFCNSPALCAEL